MQKLNEAFANLDQMIQSVVLELVFENRHYDETFLHGLNVGMRREPKTLTNDSTEN